MYVYAVRDLLVGKDIFATTTPCWGLYFIYPPIAAILMIPLGFGPYVLWQVLWTFGLVWAQQTVLRRCGVPRGWKLALIGIVVVLAVEPIRTTLGYGQVNTLLMALVVADLLPDRPGERRLLPRGTLIGLAAAIKLTPALFVIFAFLIGKRRTGDHRHDQLRGADRDRRDLPLAADGLLLRRAARRRHPHRLAALRRQPVPARRVLPAVGDARAVTLAGLAIGALVALLGTVVAAQWWRRRQKVFAVGLVGLCTCLASPLSWTHHYVWIVPLAVAVALRAQLRTGPALEPGQSPWQPLPLWTIIGGAWVVWVCACLPLALLPYGQGKELAYSPLQDVVGLVGPLLGAILIIALAFAEVRRPAARTTAQRAAPGA